MTKKHLTEEEQFKPILNNEEIDRIENDKLREIRSRYWYLRHKVFIDEVNFSDQEAEKEWDKLIEAEQKEIEVFKKGR